MQLSEEVKRLLFRLDETPENFTGRILFICRCSMTFPVDQKTTKKNVWQMLNSFLCMQKDLEKDNGHLLVLVLKRSGLLSVKTVHEENGTILLKGCWWNLQKADVQFRATSPLSRGQLQSKGVACREYTLPREEEASQPKGWIQGNTKIRPVLEVATCYLHGKNGVKIRIMSVNRDNSHSWVRISHGSNKLVTNLNNNEQEIPEVQLEEYALKLDAKDFACRSKAKAKPQRREPAGSSPRIVPIGRRTWTDIESGKYSFSDYEVSKNVMYLLRHSQGASRSRWSSSFLENQRKSSESVPAFPSLV